MCTSGAVAGPILPTGGTGSNISYTPPNATASLEKNVGADEGQARVDPSTGALIYEKTDLSVGQGKFPASLSLRRVFNSRFVHDNGRPAYRAGGSVWYPFGFGSTHNYDIRFESSEIYFGTDRYGIVTIRIGFDSVTFQKCASGFVNMKRDGSRLYADSTFPYGYRYETRGGDTLYFEGMPASAVPGGDFYCNGSTRAAPSCGYVRRWVAPNGDRADFSYQRYYSHPTNAGTAGGFKDYALTGQGAATQCHINTKGIQDCRDINQPWYVMTNGQTYPATVAPIFDYRLIEVVNSRGYKLSFQYVDSTTDTGGVCSGTPNNCSPPKNVSMERNRVASVASSVWNGTQYQPIASVQYGYLGTSGYNDNYLRKVTDPSGGVTRIDPGFVLYEPGQTVASIKPTFVGRYYDYYYPHTDEVYSTADYYARWLLYPAVTSLQRGNDTPVQYAATIAGRWVPDAYGRSKWEEFVSRMQVSDGTGTTTYDYLDDNLDDHYGPSKITNPLGYVEKSEYTSLGTLASRTGPEGIKTSFTYDVRGNLLSQRTDPKPGSGLPPAIVRAGYVGAETLSADGCSVQAICNKMLWSEDALGRRSDYEWNSSNGGIQRSLGPVLSDGARAEATVAYTSFAGMSGQSISLPTDLATRISATEWKHDLSEYGADTRRLLVGVVQSADGVTLRKCRGYDLAGNVISETSPRAGLAGCN
ncbi:MAG TPA: hypothetical protein VFG14_04030 [Chthoniobacteraceae bacterium]|nr:hypothetical protein [Chthoniobacteraceae bacterium]